MSLMKTITRYRKDFDTLLQGSGLTPETLPGLIEAWNRKVEPINHLLNLVFEITGQYIDEYEVRMNSVKVSFPLFDTVDGGVRADQLDREILLGTDPLLTAMAELDWHRDPTDRYPVLVFETAQRTQPNPCRIAAIDTEAGSLEVFHIPSSRVLELVNAVDTQAVQAWTAHLNAMRESRLGIWSVMAEDIEIPAYIARQPAAPDWLEPAEKIIGTIEDIHNPDSDKHAWMLIGKALNQIAEALPTDSTEVQPSTHWWPLQGLYSTLRTTQRMMTDHIEAQQALIEADKLITANTTLGRWLKDSELMEELTDNAQPVEITDRLQHNADRLRNSISQIKDQLDAQQRRFEEYQGQWAAGWPAEAGPVPPMPTQV